MRLLQASLLVAFLALAVAGQTTPKNKTTDYPPMRAEIMQGDLIDSVGVRFNLNEYRGKVVLLHIWATWCGPAIAEMPSLQTLQDKYKYEGLEVIGLNIGDGDGRPEPWDLTRKFMTDKKIDYRIVKAVEGDDYTKALFKISKADVVPQSFILDRNGDLRGVFLGGGPRVHALLKETAEKVVEDKPLRH